MAKAVGSTKRTGIASHPQNGKYFANDSSRQLRFMIANIFYPKP
jgi:hypothetical protein